MSGAHETGPFFGPSRVASPEAEADAGPGSGATYRFDFNSSAARGSGGADIGAGTGTPIGAERADETSAATSTTRRVVPTWVFVLASLLVAAWAGFQNFFRIGTAPILAGEPTYVEAGWQYVHGTVHAPTVVGGGGSSGALVAAPGDFGHPPLAKYLFGLAQLLGGQADDLTAARCVGSLAALLTGLVVAVWVGREAGRWAGLIAGGLLTLLPEAAGGSLGRFDRFATPDPVASLFMVLSVVLAWEWARRGGRRPWTFAALTGVAVGLAAGSRANGFLGAVGPVVLTVLLALIIRPSERRAMLARICQAVMAVAVAVLVFAALYLPLGSPINGIRYLVDFQSTQSSAGELIGFAGRVSATPPWWANLWFAGHGYGSLLTGFLVGAAVLGVLLRRDLLVGWCVASLAVPFVVYCFVDHVVLGYYWVMWTPMFLALAAIGAAEIVRLVARGVRTVSVALVVPFAVLASAAVLMIPIGASIGESATVADLQPNGVQILPSLLKQYHLTGAIVSTGVSSWAYSYYVPNAKIYNTATRPVPGTSLIVISTVQCDDPLNPSVRALAKINAADDHTFQIYADASVTIYEVAGTLARPTPAEISAEPASLAADGC